MKLSGLYVHIPFCKSKCKYCDFNSFANREESIAPYFSALLKEAEVVAQNSADAVFDSIYFGGGTPSYAGAENLALVLNFLKQNLKIVPDAEITLECNPKTLGYEDLCVLRQAGFNRLSIGLQSTEDRLLKILGRIHTAQDFENCLSDAKRAGFDNISLDIMYGLPDMTVSGLTKTLEKIKTYNVQHISAYALKIEEGTPFARMKLNLPDDDTVADMYEIIVKELKSASYERYEISNFAKKGYESRHNMKYWKHLDFWGIGLGAYSFVDNVRFSNVKDLNEYIKRINKENTAISETIPLSGQEQMSEFMFLGLRTSTGVSKYEFSKRFGKEMTEVFKEPIQKHKKWGFLYEDEDTIKLTDKAFFVSNSIFLDFL